MSVALSNPTGPIVVSGQVSFQQSANLLQITNTPGAIINWNGFSIAANEITRFLQQSSASAVLNRVVGQDPSTILGALQSNGRVFLINPNGILFGAGAQIDVAGLVASTLNLSSADFLAGRMRFAATPGAGTITSNGSIATPAGGNVYLIGSSVTNGGLVNSPQGEVLLLAGSSVELVNPATPQLRVEIVANGGEAINLGQILATSGSIGIYAGLIRSSGIIRADKAIGLPDGRIALTASQSIILEGELTASNGSVTAPNAAISAQVQGEFDVTAGQVQLQGSNINLLGGLVQTQSGVVTSGQVQVQGGSVNVAGGQVQIQGANVTVAGGQVQVQTGAISVGGQVSGAGDSEDETRTVTVQKASTPGELAKIEDVSRQLIRDHAATEIIIGIGRATSLFSIGGVEGPFHPAPSLLIVDVPRRSRDLP